ncbi:MAG TPA: hypothetical protein VGK29_24430 [Paludibaculum sp.]|jgi:hypothetical protein
MTIRAVERVCLDKAELRAMTDTQLAQLGVRMNNRQEAVLECISCGHKWSPEIDSSGKLPFDYWICPARCNSR